MLTQLSAIRVAITNKETRYNLLTLACDTGSNLVTSLSPDGLECDYDFKKNHFMRDLIAKYHKQCSSNCASAPELKLTLRKRKLENFPTSLEELPPKVDNITKCRCNTTLGEEKKSRNCSFLGCWHHKGISEDDLDR